MTCLRLEPKIKCKVLVCKEGAVSQLRFFVSFFLPCCFAAMDLIVFANVYAGERPTHAHKQTSRDPGLGAPLSSPCQARVESCSTLRYPAAGMLSIGIHFAFPPSTPPHGSPSTYGWTYTYHEAMNFAALLQFRTRMPPRGKPCTWDSFVPIGIFFLPVWCCRPNVRMHPFPNSFFTGHAGVSPALVTIAVHRALALSTTFVQRSASHRFRVRRCASESSGGG